MSNRVILTVVLALLSTMAYAQHAISVEPETTAEATPPAAASPAETSPAATPPTVVVQQPAPQPAPNVNVSVPSELDHYIIPAATREVCTVMEWGFEGIRRECRTEPIPIKAEDPALRGVCITRYGNRTCY